MSYRELTVQSIIGATENLLDTVVAGLASSSAGFMGFPVAADSLRFATV